MLMINRLANGKLRRDGNEHVNVIAGQYASDVLSAVLRTDLTADVTHL